jgi:acyl dehydratase
VTMDLERVGFESEPRRIVWSPSDCSLYALALGAGFDELAFVAENAIGHPQRVFPTFVLAGVMARESATWSHPGFQTGDYAVHQIVLGHVRLELFGRVESSGDVLVRTKVDGIYDKGSAALVELAVRADDRKSGRPIFRAVSSLFVRGEGGFGGATAPKRPEARVPDRAPDFESTYQTLGVQSLLYRHGGQDPHPIHVDPEVARRAGMRAPLLHGLNTIGIAGRMLLHAIGGSDPARMRSLEASFAAPAYNGDTLTTLIWRAEADSDASTNGAIFRVVNQDGVAVLERGRASFSEATPA